MAYDAGIGGSRKQGAKTHGTGNRCHLVPCLTCSGKTAYGTKHCKKCCDSFTAAEKGRQRVGSRDKAAGTHWQDDDVGVLGATLRFGEDVVNAALLVPAAALGVATNVSSNAALAGVNAVRVGENVADAGARRAIHMADDEERRMIVLAHIRAENPDIPDSEARAALDELFNPANASYIDDVVRNARSTAASSEQPAPAKPAGARATPAGPASSASRMAPRETPAHASGKACFCFTCVTKSASDAIVPPNAGGRATAPEPQQPRASSAEAEEFRRRAPSHQRARATSRTPERTSPHHGGSHQAHRNPHAGAESVDAQLRAAGFSYSCHMCRAEVTTSKCGECMAPVPQDHIEDVLGAPSAGSMFMDGMGSLVDALTLV